MARGQCIDGHISSIDRGFLDLASHSARKSTGVGGVIKASDSGNAKYKEMDRFWVWGDFGGGPKWRRCVVWTDLTGGDGSRWCAVFGPW